MGPPSPLPQNFRRWKTGLGEGAKQQQQQQVAADDPKGLMLLSQLSLPVKHLDASSELMDCWLSEIGGSSPTLSSELATSPLVR